VTYYKVIKKKSCDVCLFNQNCVLKTRWE